jgi:hypothetical protein
MTGMCPTAQKIQRLVAEAVQEIAEKQGLSPEEIKLRESFCWQHLQNVWFGAVSDALNASLVNRLGDSLENLPSMYRIDMNVEDLHHCIEKMFGLNANYAKGSGSEFFRWPEEYHPHKEDGQTTHEMEDGVFEDENGRLEKNYGLSKKCLL